MITGTPKAAASNAVRPNKETMLLTISGIAKSVGFINITFGIVFSIYRS